MIVELTSEAERDLEEIGDYIARDNPRRALSLVEELRAKCLDLANVPLGYPLVPRYEGHGVRRCIHGAHLIFYRADEDKVIVLHILHAAMDYSAILFPD
jgi:plasmid stabilization system protein ParE